MATFLMLLACAVFLAAFWLYNRKLFQGLIAPRIASWAMFCAITFVASTSFGAMRHDWVTAAVVITDFIVCGGTLLYLLVRRVPWFMDGVTWTAIGLCGASLLAWRITGSAASAYLLVQFAAIMAFIPTIAEAARYPKSEPWLPWFMWASAYGLQMIAVLLRWQGNGRDLVGPINAIVLHLVVGLLALRQFRKPRAAAGIAPYAFP